MNGQCLSVTLPTKKKKLKFGKKEAKFLIDPYADCLACKCFENRMRRMRRMMAYGRRVNKMKELSKHQSYSIY
jgi:hypothetical protein